MLTKIMGYIKKLFRIRNTLVNATGAELSGIRQWILLLDYFIEHFIHGVTLIEYNQYRFYWKSHPERRKFVCLPEFEKIIKISNNKDYYKYFDNKPLFNRTFNQFIGRKWIDMTVAVEQDFQNLMETNSALFVKPINGMCGRGAYILWKDGIKDLTQTFQRLKKEEAIVEEVVCQHQEMDAFNDTSVNTLRVVTMLKPDNQVQIMAALVRLGRKGEVVDNFHNYGIAALIDIETGIIKTTGVDRDFKRYVLHPDSKKPIPGFQIPSWEKIVDAVTQAASIIPEVRYVGWDLAIGKNGEVIMIEGNKSADHDVTQVTDQEGKWPLYESIVKELEVMRK